MKRRSKRSSRKQERIRLKKVDWYGLNHAKVAEKFEGDLTFVNYMNVGGVGDTVAAVYRASKPNKDKGHKEFMLLFRQYSKDSRSQGWFVSGMDRRTIKKHSTVEGVLCTQCNTALFSMTRHDFHSCGCSNDLFVDGGKDYLRSGALDISKTRIVTIDLLTDEVSVDA